MKKQHFFKSVILLAALSFSLCGFAQIDSLELSSTDSTQKHWQINTDLSSFVATVLGSINGSSFRIGFQAKRIRPKSAIRFTLEHYPRALDEGFFFASNRRIMEVSGDEVRYLSQNVSGGLSSLGIGLERRYDAKFGTAYFGTDLFAAIGIQHINSRTYWEDPTSTELDTSIFENTQRANIPVYRASLAPFVGYELQAWDHLGFSIEARVDASATYGKRFSVDEETALITTHSENIYFSSMPLVFIRIYYLF
ncbi:MAG: hypothetical protein WEC59_05925 [Salibacteraceae bacterium]